MKTLTLLLLLLSSAVFAQNEQVRVTWEANPPEENVGWYVLYWDADRTGTGMTLIAETNQTTYTLGVNFFSPAEGQEICVRVVAAKGNERSEPSDPVCLVYTMDSTTPMSFNLSKPNGVSAVLIRN